MALRTSTSRDSFTIKYKDFKLNDTEYTKLVEAVNSIHSSYNSIDADKLLEAIEMKYALMDINIPTKGINQEYEDDEIDEFVDDIIRVLKLKAPYYNELIENYTKAYDYSTGNKKIVSREDHYTRNGTTRNVGHDTGEQVNYDLPNKNVTPSTYYNNPSEATTDKADTDNTTTIAHGSDGTSSITTTYANEVLDLKRKYLAQIRNVYEEYADECKECFYLIYYTDLVKEDN